MKIAFTYDTQENYGIGEKLEYADFCLDSEASVIVDSLISLGHIVETIKGKEQIILKLNKDKYDLVFNKVEGFGSRNREGLMPAYYELLDIPYTGTDSYGFSLSLNKYHTKLIAHDLGISTPNSCLIMHTSEIKQKLLGFSFPIIVKPNSEGSSMGVKIIRECDINIIEEEVESLIKRFRQPIIIEEYIEGIDISVPIIGTKTSAHSIGIVEFSNQDGTYPEIASTEFKYVYDYKTSILNRDVNILNKISRQSLSIYNALGCVDFGRIDFRLDNKNTPYFLEINPLPTLCKSGAFDICAKEKGLSIKDIINQIVLSAIERQTNNDTK